MKKATLALAGGETFEGFACGAEGEAQGEVVFNTSHTGYQEILTDPSYAGQLVTFTVAELGNYGVHHGDEQADAPQVAGFIARRVSREPSNWRADEALPAWLSRHGVVGIEGVDTRRLGRVPRRPGAPPGGRLPPRSWRGSRTEWCSPTAPAIPPRWSAETAKRPSFSGRCPSWESASGTRFSRSQWAERRTSSSSATGERIIRCAT